MKSLIALGLILWVGLQVSGSSLAFGMPGSDAFHALGSALGSGLAVLLAGLATVLVICVFGALFVGALALSFPLLALALLIGVFLIPALLPVLIVVALLVLTLKVLATALCW